MGEARPGKMAGETPPPGDVGAGGAQPQKVRRASARGGNVAVTGSEPGGGCWGWGAGGEASRDLDSGAASQALGPSTPQRFSAITQQ